MPGLVLTRGMGGERLVYIKDTETTDATITALYINKSEAGTMQSHD